MAQSADTQTPLPTVHVSSFMTNRDVSLVSNAFTNIVLENSYLLIISFNLESSVLTYATTFFFKIITMPVTMFH